MLSSWIIHFSFDPVALQLGPIAIRWYGLCWMLAFLQANYLAGRMLARLGRRDIDVSGLTVAALFGTIVGARLAHCLFYDPAFYLSHPLKIFALWEGGMASHGGAVGFLFAIAWAAKKYAKGLPLLTLLDVVSLPASFGGAIVRIANFLNSEILGLPTSGEWGVVFYRVDQLPRIPIQLFEAIAYGLVGIFLYWQYYRRNSLSHPGRLMGWFFVLVFGFRAILEPWKMPQAAYEVGDVVSVGQWLSVPFILIGIFFVWKSRGVSRLTDQSTPV
ncbi:MAG: prolipoprotein diacylglyceryl transferase [Burkholderiaceae bacterium]|jgi:prolipoprotein diacylglyceryl transferase|nr:prolipoprotein diacylglyceryl transferase [Burkholderiaceae bacterium]